MVPRDAGNDDNILLRLSESFGRSSLSAAKHFQFRNSCLFSFPVWFYPDGGVLNDFLLGFFPLIPFRKKDDTSAVQMSRSRRFAVWLPRIDRSTAFYCYPSRLLPIRRFQFRPLHNTPFGRPILWIRFIVVFFSPPTNFILQNVMYAYNTNCYHFIVVLPFNFEKVVFEDSKQILTARA